MFVKLAQSILSQALFRINVINIHNYLILQSNLPRERDWDSMYWRVLGSPMSATMKKFFDSLSFIFLVHNDKILSYRLYKIKCTHVKRTKTTVLTMNNFGTYTNILPL